MDSTMTETQKLLAEAEASGDPKRVAAAAALRRMAKEWQEQARVNAAVNETKAALSHAESQWADKLSALALAATDEERTALIAEKRIRAEIAEAEAQLRLVGTGPESYAAKARAAVAQAEKEYVAEIGVLRAAVKAAGK